MKKKLATIAILSLILLFCSSFFSSRLFANENAVLGTNYIFSIPITYAVRFRGDFSATIAREGKINEVHSYHFTALNSEVSIGIYDGDGLRIRVYNSTGVIIDSYATSSDTWNYFNFSSAHGNYTIEIIEDSWGYVNGNYYGLEIVVTDRIFMNESQSSLYPGYSPPGNYYGSNDAMILGRGAGFSAYETYEIPSDGNFSFAIYDGDYIAALVYSPSGSFYGTFVASSNNTWDVFAVSGMLSGNWKIILFDLKGINDYSTGGNFYRIATDEAGIYVTNESISDILSIYDFSTNAGVDRYAYRWEVDALPPSTNDTPSVEFTSLQYQNIFYDDGTFQTDIAARGFYAAHRFVLTLNESSDEIALLHILWNGRGRHLLTPGATIFLWNYTASKYDALVMNSVASEDTLEAYVLNSSNYIRNGKLILLVEQNSYTRRIWVWTIYSIIDTDYIMVEVITK